MGADVIAIRFIICRREHNFIIKSSSLQSYYCLLLTSVQACNNIQVPTSKMSICHWFCQNGAASEPASVGKQFSVVLVLLPVTGCWEAQSSSDPCLCSGRGRGARQAQQVVRDETGCFPCYLGPEAWQEPQKCIVSPTGCSRLFTQCPQRFPPLCLGNVGPRWKNQTLRCRPVGSSTSLVTKELC